MKKETKEAYTTALTALIFLWFFTLLAALAFSGEAGSARTGIIGDSFGALNALISICGFAAIVYTIQKEHEDSLEGQTRHEATVNQQKTNAMISGIDTPIAVESRFMEVSQARVDKIDLALRKYYLHLLFETNDQTPLFDVLDRMTGNPRLKFEMLHDLVSLGICSILETPAKDAPKISTMLTDASLEEIETRDKHAQAIREYSLSLQKMLSS